VTTAGRPAVRWLIGYRLRRRWGGLLLLVAIVTLGGGSALVALGAAERTSGAYAEYLDRADVGDAAINPSLQTEEIDAVLRGLPGVRVATREAMFFAEAFHDPARPLTYADEAALPPILVRGSIDGRRTTMDRPVVLEGRRIEARDEVLVTTKIADDRGVQLGDTFDIAFASEDLAAEPEDLIVPIATERVTVVGVVTLPDEVLPDGLYSREGTVIVSDEMAADYDCTPSLPPVDVTFEEAVEVLLPADCSTSYPYYSLDIEGGADSVAATLDAFTAAADELNAIVPTVLTEQGIGHYLIATTTSSERERVERAVQPTSTALGVLGLGAAGVTLVVAGLAIARDLRRAGEDVVHWHRFGMSRGQRASTLAVPMVAAIALGVLLALAVAWLASPVGPVGVVRAVDPSPARELSWLVVAGMGGLALVGEGAVALLAVRAARRTGLRQGVRPARPAPRILGASNRPAVATGLRAAFGGNRGSGLVAASGGLAVGVLLAAVVFGATLSSVVSTPASYGWPWDAGVMGGFGYGRQDQAAIEATLDGHDDVVDWAGIAVRPVSVDGKPVMAVVGIDPPHELDLTMSSGRLPVGPDEIALGSRTAASVGADVGDVVELGDLAESVEATVTGIAVLPSLGPYLSDRAAPGVGAVLSEARSGNDPLDDGVTFVGLHVADDADPTQVLEAISVDFEAWSVEGDPTFSYAEPVRPPEIIDASSMRAVPVVVGALLAFVAILGLLFAVVVSVRSRRRELGTLRALGFTGAQLRTSVRVQTLVVMAAALAVGIPLGLVVGRLSWRAFATRLGVVTDPTMPWLWIAVTVLGGLLAALVAAAVPARVAARTEAAEILRSE
jgi:hypothetical protein